MSKHRPQTVGDLLGENRALRARLAALQDAEAGRRHADRILGEQQEKFRSILEQSPIGIALFDAAGRLVDANPACLEMFGVADLDAVLGIRFFDDSNVTDEVKQRLRNGQSDRHETEYDFERAKALGLYPTTKSGTIRLDTLITPLRQADGRAAGGYLVQVQDITDRKRAEAALRESDREKAAILDSLAEHVVHHSMDMTIRWANRIAAESVGLEPEQLVGKTCWELWHRRRTPCDGCPVVAALETGQTQTAGMKTPDGRSWRVTGCPVRDDQGHIVGVVETTQEITERVRAVEALRLERDFARNLVETARVIVIVLDTQARVMLFNPFAEALTGYTEDEAKRLDWFETFVPPRGRQRIRAVVRGILDGETHEEVVNPIVAKDGHEILVRWHSSVLRDAEGNVTGLLGLGHDITEIRRREAQLRQGAKMEALGRLAGGVAHDFNNMLAVIQGYADLLARSLSSPEAHEDLGRIQSAAERAADLTAKLLAFGRRGVAEPRALRFGNMLDDLQPMLRRAMGESVELTVTIQPDLWAVKADRSQIEQVILNLAVNASQAMPDNRGRLAIEAANVALGARTKDRPENVPSGEYVLLSVSDNGVGMSAEVTQHLFEPFYTTRRGQGMGLGLASTYGIVTQSGGHIAVDSAPDEGATFRIYLPRTDETPREPPETLRPPSATEALPKGTETVLVVEDEEDVRHLIVQILRKHGYTVMEAGSAREAIPLGEHYDGVIHLLVTDVVMPAVSGLELARHLRRVRHQLKTLYVSAYTDPSPAGRDRLRRGVNLLTKPFSAQELAETVRRILDSTKRKRPRAKPRKGPRDTG